MSKDVWTIQAAMEWTEGYLGRKGIEHPRRQTQELASYATGLARIELYTNFDRPLSGDERAVLRDAVQRRGSGEPLQYIVGRAPFRYLDVAVSPAVLIPRPETEGLVDCVLSHLAARENTDSEPALVADVGTGSGCIACSIVSEFENCIMLASDISSEAIEIAATNREALGLDNKIMLFEGNAGEAFPIEYEGRYDAVVSNPPYIPSSVMKELPEEVVGYEPAIALDGGDDGLRVYRKIASWAARVLLPGGLFACELFEDCVEEAVRIALDEGFAHVEARNDLSGRPRYMLAWTAEHD